MSYENVIDRIQLLLQGLTTYFIETGDVTIGDDSRLDRGKECVAVLWPANFNSDEAENYQSTKYWQTKIDLFVRFGAKGSPATVDKFIQLRDAVITKLDQYPTLNGIDGVTQIVITGEDEPLPVYQKSKSGSVSETGPAFLMQTLIVTVTQRVALSGGEYV
jgi:hypothetical protein